MPRPCPAALATFGVPARRWSTRADLYAQLEKAREHLAEAGVGASIASAAACAGLSAYHFARLFHETYGDTPAAFHKRALMDRAHILLETDSVGEVAFELGYASASTFARAFRRHFGASPSSIQRIALQR